MTHGMQTKLAWLEIDSIASERELFCITTLIIRWDTTYIHNQKDRVRNTMSLPGTISARFLAILVEKERKKHLNTPSTDSKQMHVTL